jgi:hypothetical protein
MAVLLAALAPCQLAPVPAAAQDLPPAQPAIAFSAEYRLEQNNGGRFEWGRRRLFVEGAKVRDELLDGDLDTPTQIADRDSGTVLSFEPDDPSRIVHAGRLGRDATLPAMAQGYGAVARSLGSPRVLGMAQIAGRDCTRLVWETVGERQEWCVTVQGIPLAARRRAGVQESRIEVLTLDLDPPDPAVFELPAGFTAHGD